MLIISACGSTPVENTTVQQPTLSPEEQVLAQPNNTEAPIPETINELEGSLLPPGFSITKYAEVFHPLAITFDQQGNMLAASSKGNILIIFDENKDGKADTTQIIAEKLWVPLGIAAHPETGDIYISHQGFIKILRDPDQDYIIDAVTILASHLPYGLHQNNNLTFEPDGMLYVGIGSTCDVCDEEDPRNATIMRFNVKTGESEIFASGLRNSFDHAFHPLTGDLFATDNGQANLGMNSPYEELNHVIEGQHYGWPNCWNQLEDPSCENTIPAIGFFEPHSSVNGAKFYTGSTFPEEYNLNLFVSVFGTFLDLPLNTGLKRVILTPDGDTYKTEITWFALMPEGVRPLPLVQGPDGALYFGDYMNDAIYRISYGLPQK